MATRRWSHLNTYRERRRATWPRANGLVLPSISPNGEPRPRRWEHSSPRPNGFRRHSQSAIAIVSSRLRLILPAPLYTRGHGFREVNRIDLITFNVYLSTELDVSRLNAIQPYLWLTDFENVARSSQEHITSGRQIIVTEQTDLHIVGHAFNVYTEALPEFLLCDRIWKVMCQYL